MEYNKNQERAVTHKDGPMIVLAGPGSGKTAVITGRARYLIEKYGIPAQNILVITFTKAATIEMRERFFAMTDGEQGVHFSTFHALFFMIIRAAYGYSSEQIITEDIKYRFVREEIARLNIDISDEKDFTKDVLSEISLVKSEEIDINMYYSLSCPADTFRTIFADYENLLRAHKLIDFDDMMLICRELFNGRPDILAGWQGRYKYILIDEFQDINKLQYDLIKMIALPENNLFIVGDDDQSIYRFRGAKPEIMLSFPKEFPGAQSVLLDQNYRSSSAIVKAAGTLIAKNTRRFKKELHSAVYEDKAKPFPLPTFTAYSDKNEENIAIISKIQGLLKSGISLKNMAILFRTNQEARLIMSKLMEYNIPFISKDQVPSLYEHFIAGDLLSYMQLALIKGSEEEGFDATKLCSSIRSCLSRIMNRPSRYFSKDLLPEALTVLANTTDCYDAGSFLHKYFVLWKKNYVKEKHWMAERVDELEDNLRLMSKMDPFSQIHYIRKVVGYDDFLKSYAGFRNINPDDLLETAEDLQADSKGYATLSEYKAYINEYNAKLAENKNVKATDALIISTIHSSKGLEYDAVFIPDANDGIMPYKKALTDEDLEEERRLFYVAITRARTHLHISYVKKMYGKTAHPSPYITEMQKP
ncbi:MAG: ATP-dependent helicase [Lachnospiraceae bacterium]|nr:ATP-dependent helicase [Lachnospiraceae bacterium]